MGVGFRLETVENQKGTQMTCSSLAFSVSPSCPRKGCFCCTASTCVLSFLLTSEPFPPQPRVCT